MVCMGQVFLKELNVSPCQYHVPGKYGPGKYGPTSNCLYFLDQTNSYLWCLWGRSFSRNLTFPHVSTMYLVNTGLVNTDLLLIAFISWARLIHNCGAYGAGLSQGT